MNDKGEKNSDKNSISQKTVKESNLKAIKAHSREIQEFLLEKFGDENERVKKFMNVAKDLFNSDFDNEGMDVELSIE